jgi:hypothetical protein
MSRDDAISMVINVMKRAAARGTNEKESDGKV